MSEAHKCCARVYNKTTWKTQPCGKNAKIESDGKHYCGTHDPAKAKAREAERDKKWDVALRKRQIELAAVDLLEALREAISVIQKIKPKGYGDGTIVRGKAAIEKATGESQS